MTGILVVESDGEIRRTLAQGLVERGHAVDVVTTGTAAMEAVLVDFPEVVLLGLDLPDVDGLALVAMIRTVSTVPVIVLAAADDELDMVRGLDAGADDYVVTPFRLDQVIARVRAVLRRYQPSPPGDPIRVGELAIDAATRSATLAGRDLELSRREFDLLLALAQHAGEIVGKQTLLAQVWRRDVGSTRTVDVHLTWLRHKLGEDASRPQYLETVRGIGVRLVDPAGTRPLSRD